MANKLIDDGGLSRFWTNAVTYIAQNFVTRIVYNELPAENNYIGRQVFLTTDEHQYVYTSTGWKKMPWTTEVPFEYDSSGNIVAKS